MKLLLFIYVLLSLAVADLGWLFIKLSFAAPTTIFTPVLFINGLFFMVGGILVSIRWLVPLLWQFMAYEPDRTEVSSKKIRNLGKLLLAFIAFNGVAHYALRPHSDIYKSKIIFKDPALAVQDSMLVLRQICETIEAKQFLSCYVQPRDSTLFFSTPLRRSVISSNLQLGRIDTITVSNEGFRDIKREDVVRFLSVIRFLNRNRIAGLVHDTSIGVWRYPYSISMYREDEWFSHDKQQGMCLYLLNIPRDRVRPSIMNYLQVIDRQNQIILAETPEIRVHIGK